MQQGDTSIKPILQVIVSTCILLSNIFELIYNYKLHFIEDIQSTLGNLSALNSLHHQEISPVHVVTLERETGLYFYVSQSLTSGDSNLRLCLSVFSIIGGYYIATHFYLRKVSFLFLLQHGCYSHFIDEKTEAQRGSDLFQFI